jgi:hypothetical protein
MARPDRDNKYCSRTCAGVGARLSVEYIEQDRGFETPCWVYAGALHNGYGRRRGVRLHRAY